MNHTRFVLLLIFLAPVLSHAQLADSVRANNFLDSISSSLKYQQGTIQLDGGIGSITVPAGFGYLDPKQSEYVIKDLWGNPSGDGTLGMLVPQDRQIVGDNSWAFIITFDELGYVKDDDADDIDYDDLLDEMKSDITSSNGEREKNGFEKIELVGWAAKPFYDADKKVLHWAKELKFGDVDGNTLNYNVRILGRKGVAVLNAVAGMNDMNSVQTSIEPVLASFTFADGHKYSDFDPDVDEVAAWTIGGLVAGKMLSKVGVFAFLLKYIKLVIVGGSALATAAWRWFRRKTELPEVRNIEESTKS